MPHRNESKQYTRYSFFLIKVLDVDSTFFFYFFIVYVCLFTFTWFTGDNSQEAQQADLIHGQATVGPRCVQTVPGTAFLSGHPSHQHHVAPLVLTLLQPAYPSCKKHIETFEFTQTHINQYK